MASTKLKDGRQPYKAVMDAHERASRDEIRALQTQRLAWSLKHAYDNVAHYRNAFDKAGVHPSDFRELSDLAKFPFTVKTDLRDNYPFNMFAVPREKLVRVHASSGTTGKPIVVGYTQGDIDIWSDVMARSIRAAGGRSGMIMHNAYGYGLFTGGLGAHYGRERVPRPPWRGRRRAGRALRRGTARLHRGAGVGGDDRAAGAADQRFPTRHHHRDAELHARDPGRVQAAAARLAQVVAEVRDLRRRTVDQCDARRNRAGVRHGCHRYLWPIGGHWPRRRAGMRRDQGRPAYLGGSF